jgi:chromate reductase
VKILGFAGSLRQASFNRALLRAAKELTPAGVEIDIADLDGVPMYNSDLETSAFPATVKALRAHIAASGAVLIATPEYMFSVSGVLKNVLDWLARPPEPRALWDKPVGIMGASPGLVGTARAQLHLRQILLHERAAVLPHPQLLVPDARNKFDANGVLIDQETRTKVTEYVDALARWARRLT